MEPRVDPRFLAFLECRSPWRPDFGPEWTRFPIARLRYVQARRQWQICWRDRNLKFHIDDRVPPTPIVEDLLAEIDAHPKGILWG